MELSPSSATDQARYGRMPKARKSRITNGKDLLPNIDGRSIVARRYRDIVGAILVDQGGEDRCSESRKHLIRRFAAAAVLAERLEARLVSGADIDIQEHATLCSALVRLGARIGIDRVSRDISPTLSDYLAEAHHAEAEDAAFVGEAEDEDTPATPVGAAAPKAKPAMALDSAPPNKSDPDLDEDIARDIAHVCRGEVL